MAAQDLKTEQLTGVGVVAVLVQLVLPDVEQALVMAVMEQLLQF
jgi:hypothetical protein